MKIKMNQRFVNAALIFAVKSLIACGATPAQLEIAIDHLDDATFEELGTDKDKIEEGYYREKNGFGTATDLRRKPGADPALGIGRQSDSTRTGKEKKSGRKEKDTRNRNSRKGDGRPRSTGRKYGRPGDHNGTD